MTSVTQNVKERFTNLRKKLDQMGYMQPLSIDSLPLIESVFTDLIWTTDNFRKCKIELDQRVEVRQRLEEYLEPYKKDNGRLLNENNRLQKKILEMKVKNDEYSRDLQCRIRQLEDEKEDLKLFSEQCTDKLKKYEVEAKKMVEKIIQLQEKNSQAVIHTPDGKRKQIPYLRQRMDIDYFIAGVNSNHPMDADDSCANSKSPSTPTTTNDNCRGQYTTEQVNLLDCVTNKCKELTHQLHHARDQLELNDRKITGYSNQLQLYEQEIQRLVQELSGGRSLEALSSESETKSRDRLLDQLNLQLDLLQQRNDELERRLISTNDVTSSSQNLEMQNKQLIRKLEIATDRERCLMKDIHRANAMLKQKSHLLDHCGADDATDEVTPLSSTEDSVKCELEMLHRQIKSLEQDRQYWKRQAQTTPRRGSQDMTGGGMSKDEEESHDLFNQMKRMSRENQQLKKLLRDREEDDDPVPTRDYEYELDRVKSERDRLQQLLDKFERQLHDIQGNVKVLTCQRDSIQQQYNQSELELKQMRQTLVQLNCQGSRPNPSPVTAMLKRLEIERDQALSDLHEMTTERDSLRHRLQALSQSALDDKSRLTQQVEDSQFKLAQYEEQIDQWRDEARSLREKIGQLEETVRILKDKNEHLKDSIEQERQSNQNLMRQLTELDSKVDQTNQDVTNKSSLLINAEKTMELLQKNSQELTHNNKNLEQEVARMKRIIDQLDEEKDQLQQSCDEKSEQIRDLLQKLSVKEQALDEIRFQTTGLEQQLSRIQDVNNCRDGELRALILQNEQLESDLRSQRQQADEYRVKLCRRDEDIMDMEREKLHQEQEFKKIQRSVEQIQDDKERLTMKLDQLQRFEEDQQHQNNQLLDQYRQMNLERDKWQAQAEQMQRDLQELEKQLDTRDNLIANQRDQNYRTEKLLESEQHKLQQLEVQMSNLTQVIDTNHEALNCHSAEKHELIQELGAMRDLCNRLESSKLELQHQLSARLLDAQQSTTTTAQLQHELSSVSHEREDLQQQIASLQTMLSAARHKEYSSEVALQTQINSLQQQLELSGHSQQQAAQLKHQLDQLQQENHQVQLQNETLRRQLTSEKFKLEMANQELRRRQSGPQNDSMKCISARQYTEDYVRHSPVQLTSSKDFRTKPSELPEDTSTSSTSQMLSNRTETGFYPIDKCPHEAANHRTDLLAPILTNYKISCASASSTTSSPSSSFSSPCISHHPRDKCIHNNVIYTPPQLATTSTTTSNSTLTNGKATIKCYHGCLHSRNCTSTNNNYQCKSNCRHSDQCRLGNNNNKHVGNHKNQQHFQHSNPHCPFFSNNNKDSCDQELQDKDADDEEEAEQEEPMRNVITSYTATTLGQIPSLMYDSLDQDAKQEISHEQEEEEEDEVDDSQLDNTSNAGSESLNPSFYEGSSSGIHTGRTLSSRSSIVTKQPNQSPRATTVATGTATMDIETLPTPTQQHHSNDPESLVTSSLLDNDVTANSLDNNNVIFPSNLPAEERPDDLSSSGEL